MKAPAGNVRMPGKAKPKAKRASGASGARKPAAKAKKTANAGTKARSPPKAGAKAKPGASEAKPIKVRKGEKVAVVLSGGNPRIAKADGDAPVQAYIAGMPGWKRDLGSASMRSSCGTCPTCARP